MVRGLLDPLSAGYGQDKEVVVAGTRATRAGWIAWALVAGCGEPVVPDAAVGPLGTELCKVGHPHAECGVGRVAGQSGGPLSLGRSKERWVDVAVPYTRKDEAHEMVIRVSVKKLSPCVVATNVVADDGPNPVLLDNPVTSKIAGDAICSELLLK